MKNLTKAALVAVSIAALGSVSSAAYAAGEPATLPETDTIYQANYSADPAALWTTAADGTATVIGTPTTTGLADVVDGAWDPATGASYVIGNGYEGPCELWEADITTGEFTQIALVTGPEGPTFSCDAFDIAPDGTAWITIYDGDLSGVLAKLNLTDGTTSAHVSITGLNNGPSWIAVQPSTGTLYLSDWSDTLYTVDTTTGAATLVTTLDDGIDSYDAAFDSAGRLWVTAWPDWTVLYSADVADYANTLTAQGEIQVDGSGDDTGTDSIWIARSGAVVDPVKPALADTGVDTTVALAAGFGMLLLGAGVIAARRFRRA